MKLHKTLRSGHISDRDTTLMAARHGITVVPPFFKDEQSPMLCTDARLMLDDIRRSGLFLSISEIVVYGRPLILIDRTMDVSFYDRVADKRRETDADALNFMSRILQPTIPMTGWYS